jgi:hypothetical protein
MLRILNILVLLCASTMISWSNKLTTMYIEDYKMIAIGEMKKSGIPASIKLAQGILESDLGRSDLATKANNHFGIKCGKDWSGKSFYQLDDDVDSTGNLVESCFRVFGHPAESYAAHTTFLTNPGKRSRYGFLFDYAITDYVAWANGLRSAGYATDTSYPTKLIKIIEEHKLYLLDQGFVPVKPSKELALPTPTEKSKSKSDTKVNQKTNNKSDNVIAVKESKRNDRQEATDKIESRSKESKTDKNRTAIKYLVEQRNELRYVTTAGGENLNDIARAQHVDVFDLLSYNEEINTQHAILDKGEIIYLEKKKKSSPVDFHTVAQGETLYDISQRYGIRLESLCLKNNVRFDAEIAVGQQVSLSKFLSKKDTPKHSYRLRFDRFLDLGETK